MLRLLLWIVLSTVVPVSASYAASGDGVDKDAVHKVLRGRFVGERNLKSDKGMGTSNVEGFFSVVPGRGVIWAMEKPKAGILVFTENHIALIMNDNLVARGGVDKHPGISRIPGLLADGFIGKWDAFEKDYVIERANDKDGWGVKLTTKELNRTKAVFTVITARGDQYTNSVGLVESNGSYTSYKLFDQKIIDMTGAVPEESFFNIANAVIPKSR